MAVNAAPTLTQAGHAPRRLFWSPRNLRPELSLARGFAITPSVGHARTPWQSERLRNGPAEISCTLV